MKAIAVDTGGTFTDIVVFDYETGTAQSIKVESTPEDPGRAIIQGIEELFTAGMAAPQQVAAFAHGTTVGTNLLLQNRGARVGLLVTGGFSGLNSVWHLPRFGADLCDIFIENHSPVEPRLCIEVPERVGSQGELIEALDLDQAVAAVRLLRERGAESLAAVFLFSFLNPSNEQALAQVVAEEFPQAMLSLSSSILPQIREFPRMSTTVANARIAPTMRAYLDSLERRLRERGLAGEQLYIMQSNGGVSKLSGVTPITTLLSGPCAGAEAAMAIAAAAGYTNTISLDMGGTSTDIALGEGGKVLEQSPVRIGAWEIGVPMLMINTIGAGGGTITRLDRGGALQVGPDSAGADPGPVCYGKGGTEPTVTDANLVLGFLHPEHLLRGKVKIHRQQALDAITALGKRVGLDPLPMAEGILRIINTKMEEGIREVSTERGYDVRDFALVAFGGAGPLHAGVLAANLGITTVIVPPVPGASSALGLVMVDMKRDYVTSRIWPLTQMDPAELDRLLAGLQQDALREFTAEGFAAGDLRWEYLLDLRYQGQGYELTVAVRRNPNVTGDAIAALRADFDRLHEQLYGHSAANQAVEAVNYRVRVTAEVPKFAPTPRAAATSDVAAARSGERPVCFDSRRGFAPCAIYDRDLLEPGHRVPGPAIVDQFDSTTIIYPDQTAVVDSYGNLIITTSTGGATP